MRALPRLFALMSLILLPVLACRTRPPASGAAVFSWGQHLDTPIDVAGLFAGDRTLVVRFLALYERAWEQAILSTVRPPVSPLPAFRVSVGLFFLPGAPQPPDHTPALGLQLDASTSQYVIPNPVPAPVDYRTRGDASPVPQPVWRQLALVRRGTVLEVWLDGVHVCRFSPAPIPCDMPLPAALPSGMLRLGRRETSHAVETEAQLHGYLDDVALFDRALLPGEIQLFAVDRTGINGAMRGLLAGINFNDPALDPSPLLVDPRTLTGPGGVVAVSPNHDGAPDVAAYPVFASARGLELPFQKGEEWEVLQGTASNGSHAGQAAFCWDFIYVPPNHSRGQPQSDGGPSRDRVFFASAPGKVSVLQEGFAMGTAAPDINHVDIEARPRELVSYLHLAQNSLGVALNATVAEGDALARVSDVGSPGAFHLHLAVLDTTGPFYVTRPATFRDYCVSRDFGRTWRRQLNGMPQVGEWLRRVRSDGTCDPVSPCERDCAAQRDACMRDVSAAGGSRPAQCVGEYRGCLRRCPQ